MTVLVLLLKACNNYLIKWHLDVWLEDVGSEAPGKTESLLCYHMPSSDSRAISPIASTPQCPLFYLLPLSLFLLNPNQNMLLGANLINSFTHSMNN